MHSSADEDEMFPDEALPNTSTTTAPSTLDSPSTPHTHPPTAADLSPPNSQGPRDPSTFNANGKRPLSLAQPALAGAHADPETGYSWSKQEEAPGFEWKNTRAREEESRALDQIVELGAQVKGMYVCFVGSWLWDEADALICSAVW